MSRTILLLSVVFTILAGAAFCQTNDEGLAFLEFNFFNPGARALGMGGAFVGLADDSTAALANPAGLTTLIRPEVSVEFASTNYNNSIPWNGGFQTYTASVDPVTLTTHVTGFQMHYVPKDFSNTSSNVSFASAVYPIRANKLVFSAFYNEQTKFKRITRLDDEGFGNCLQGDDSCTVKTAGLGTSFLPSANTIDLSIRTIGFSMSLRPFRQVDVGGTLNISRLKLDSTTDRLNNGELQNEFTLNSDNTKASFTVGGLISPSEYASFGLVYSRRPKYDATAVSNVPGFAKTGVSPIQEQNVGFRVPDSFAAGVSVKPSDFLRLNADTVFIRYSQMMEGYYNARFNQGKVDQQRSEGNPTLLQTEGYQHNTLEVEDGVEFRVGGEYVFRLGQSNRSVAVRSGYWHEPFHSIIQTVDDASLTMDIDKNNAFVSDTRQTPFWSRTLKDEFNGNHVTAGIGFTMSRFTLDGAFDYSKNFKRFIISSVFYLGKEL